jgi:putative ABC transport system permease protein
MLKNYLRIALRYFLKQKLYSFINIAGLAVGIACFVLIVLYVQYELSFDRYHKKADRIYRVVAHQPGNVFLGSDHFAVTQALLGQTLKEEYPEVLEAVTLDKWDDVLVSVGDNHYYEDGLLWANPDILDVFTFPLVEGDPTEPFSIVLSENVARKYFGEEDPVGKIIRLQDKHDFKVTGVMRDVPQNSHFHFIMLASFETLIAISDYKGQFTEWGNSSFYTYILVAPHFNQKAFEAKLTQIVHKYHTEPWRDQEHPHRYYLQPLTDIHLHSHINFDLAHNNDMRYIYLLSGLALIILLIACVNYMNLTTARASLRAKEVGMRKVIGANRLQLFRQFVGESLMLTVLAAIIALLLVELVLPLFSSLVGRELSLSLVTETQIFFVLVATIILVGFLSGSYPALYLTALRPLKIIKGERISSGRSGVHNVLVISQFATSIALIVCTTVVHKQLRYIQNKKLGYNREQVLVMRMRDPDARKEFELVKRDLLADANFIKVTRSAHLPTNISSQTGLAWTERKGQPPIRSYQSQVDPDFLDVFEIGLVEGRNFSHHFGTDSARAYIINEKLRDLLGWESAVGKPFGPDDKPDGVVIGVMKNFHMHSLRQKIHPLFIRLGSRWSWYASARIRTDHVAAAIRHMRKVWKTHSANYPLEYFFLDDEFNRMYQAEQKLAGVFSYATTLAIFIACLGLLGLATFMVERRTKEIGIRKVLGASVSNVVGLLSKDFVKLVIVANLIAWPVAGYAMNKWLQDFAYHVEISWWIFVLAGGLALMIALATVSMQAIRAAVANPVDSLRYE